MKERELTRTPVDSTLELGIKFMPEPGQNESKVPQEKVEVAKKAWANLNKGRRPLSVDERRVQQFLINRGVAPIMGGSEESSERVEKENLKRNTSFTGENKQGKTVFQKEIEFTPDKAKEFLKLLEGNNLTDEEKYKMYKMQQALENDPEGFAEVFAKAIDTLPSEDVKKFLEKHSENSIELFLHILKRTSRGKLKDAEIEDYRKRAREIKTLPEKEAKVEFSKLISEMEDKRREFAAVKDIELTQEEKERVWEWTLESYMTDIPKEKIDSFIKRFKNLKNLSDKDFNKEANKIFDEIDEEKVQIFGAAYPGRAAEPDKNESESEIPHSFVNEDKGELEVLMENLSVLSKYADDPSNMNQLKGDIHIRGLIGRIYSTNEAALKAALIEIEQIDAIEDYDQWKAKYKTFMSSLKASAKTAASLFSGIESSENKDFDAYGVPNSAEAVAEWISKNIDSEIWGPNGVHPIIENDKFNQANFLLWVRDWSVKLHNGNPNDQMSPLTAISLKIGISEVQLYTMVFHNRERFMKSKTTGRVLNDLADQAYLESWFFGVLRNTSLAYSQIMTNDVELPKALTQFHAKSDLTRGTNLKTMLSAPAEFGKEGDTTVGDGIRTANDLYYHWSDADKLKEILNGNEFTVDDFKNAMRVLQNKKEWDKDDWDNVGTYKGFHAEGNNIYYQIGQSKKKEMFDQNGKLKWDNFIFVMNFYKENTAEQFTMDVARELVRGKLSQKYDLLSDGIAHSQEERDILTQEWKNLRATEFERLTKLGKLSKEEIEQNAKQHADHILMTKRHAKRINLEYAEYSSFEMQRGYGIAARNDTNRRGFDAATKLFLSDYLIRQSGENTAGPIGIPGEIPIFKMLAPDMWIGLKTESGLSPYAIYEAIRKVENDPNLTDEEKKKQKKEWMDKLSFRARAENEYAGNQNSNAFDIFKNITDANNLDLNEIVSYSLLEGIKYNPQKFEAMIKDGFIKPMRYAFSSNNGLDYGSTVRVFDFQTHRHKPESVPIYKDQLLAQAMFGDRAFEGLSFTYKIEKDGKISLVKDKEPGSKTVNLLSSMNSSSAIEKEAASKYLSSTEVRSKMVKNLARTRIAAQLAFHRQFGGIGPRWDYDRAETFIKALQSMKTYEIDPEDPNQVRQTGAAYFSREDIAWIRKHSNTRLYRLVGEALASQGGLALASAAPKMLGTLLQYIIKQ